MSVLTVLRNVICRNSSTYYNKNATMFIFHQNRHEFKLYHNHTNSFRPSYPLWGKAEPCRTCRVKLCFGESIIHEHSCKYKIGKHYISQKLYLLIKFKVVKNSHEMTAMTGLFFIATFSRRPHQEYLLANGSENTRENALAIFFCGVSPPKVLMNAIYKYIKQLSDFIEISI